jgi:hypothetical protein
MEARAKDIIIRRGPDRARAIRALENNGWEKKGSTMTKNGSGIFLD